MAPNANGRIMNKDIQHPQTSKYSKQANGGNTMHLKKNLNNTTTGKDSKDSPRNSQLNSSKDNGTNEATNSGKKLIHNTSLKFSNNRKANGSPSNDNIS